MAKDYEPENSTDIQVKMLQTPAEAMLFDTVHKVMVTVLPVM